MFLLEFISGISMLPFPVREKVLSIKADVRGWLCFSLTLDFLVLSISLLLRTTTF